MSGNIDIIVYYLLDCSFIVFNFKVFFLLYSCEVFVELFMTLMLFVVRSYFNEVSET